MSREAVSDRELRRVDALLAQLGLALDFGYEFPTQKEISEARWVFAEVVRSHDEALELRERVEELEGVIQEALTHWLYGRGLENDPVEEMLERILSPKQEEGDLKG